MKKWSKQQKRAWKEAAIAAPFIAGVSILWHYETAFVCAWGTLVALFGASFLTHNFWGPLIGQQKIVESLTEYLTRWAFGLILISVGVGAIILKLNTD